MMTLEALKRKIATADELLSVVKTMKSLAAANMRHLERAAGAVAGYAEVVDLGWRAWFRTVPLPWGEARPGPAVLLVLGSDQGMCGQFNEIVAKAAVAHARELAGQGRRVAAWTMGERVAPALADRGLVPKRRFALPGGLAGITPAVRELVGAFMAAGRDLGATVLTAVTNEPVRLGGYCQATRRLLPLDREFGRRARELGWPGNQVPMVGAPGQAGALASDMLRHLFRQTLFISFYRAMALSMAAENAARLAAMQAAEKNIQERAEELQADFRETRQTLVTAELLDIAAGFEAIAGSGAAPV